MSLALKHIPCPAGSRCTAFHCIFGHPNERDPQPSSTALAKDTGLLQQEGQDSVAGQQRPRKRLKTENAEVSLLDAELSKGSHVTDSTASEAEDCQKAGDNQSLEGNVVPSTTRPISPPPVKRAASTAISRSGASPSLRSAQPKKAAPSTNDRTVPSLSKTAPISKKIESLNPRLLKSSPASHEVRLKLLRLLHKEFTRLNWELQKDANDEEQLLVLGEQGLIHRALDEEEKIAVEKAAVYPNLMKNKIMQYKRMTVAQWKTSRTAERKAARKTRQDDDMNEKPVIIETGLTHAQEVQLLKRIRTHIDGLSKHGYVSKVPSDEAVGKAQDGVEASHGFEKCDRCEQRFQVFPGRREEDGALTSGGSCKFHWGKAYVPAKAPDELARVPKRFRCCGEELGESAGCFVHDHHVFKTGDAKRLATVLNFAATPENPLVLADIAVCFDCEMGYTVYGMELIRLTATSWPTGEELLDVLVRPLGEILDLNSRFSGVWPEDLARAKPWTAAADDDPQPSKSGEDSAGSEDGEVKSRSKAQTIVSSPEVARDLFFSLISPTTTLIGHGLENDLNALRVVHPTLVDTALLYPHNFGLPYRNGLKALMDVHLNRKIQQETGSKVVGHDSAEDARAAGELVRLKVMREWKDLQRVGWTVADGELVPPRNELDKEGGLSEKFIES